MPPEIAWRISPDGRDITGPSTAVDELSVSTMTEINGARRAAAARLSWRPGRPPMTSLEEVTATLRAALGADRIVTDRQELRTYECDGLAHYKVTPGLVVLPRD